MTQCTTQTPLQKLIAEAESAYHKLQMGVAVVEIVDQNGERVRFQPANSQRLYLYIQQLRAQLPCEVSTYRPNGPAGFFF